MFSTKLNMREILDPSDVFFEHKAEWAKRLYKYLTKHVTNYTAERLTKILINKAFRTSTSVSDSVEGSKSDDLGSIDIFFGIGSLFTGGSRTVERVRKVTTAYQLGFDFQNLITIEHQTIKDLGLNNWLYPFACINLLLLADKNASERYVGVREAVILWTTLVLQLSSNAKPNVETVINEAESRYGPMDRLPK